MFPFLLSIAGSNDTRLMESKDLRPNLKAEENLSLIAPMWKSSLRPIEENRQSVSKAREAWQNATGKEASDATLKRF